MELKGKAALVTGASSGVGRAISLAMAEHGAGLALVGRDIGRLRDVAAECEGRGAAVKCYKTDLAVDNHVRNLREDVIHDWHGIDLLIHSAGIIQLARWPEATLEDFDRQYRCNVRAPFALTQLFLPELIERRGQVVFINSTSGLAASWDNSQYAATKHALKAIADSLREETNPMGVRVISVYLGRTATPMQHQVYDMKGERYCPEQFIQPEQVASTVVNAILIGRESEITDIRIRPSRKSDFLKQ